MVNLEDPAARLRHGLVTETAVMTIMEIATGTEIVTAILTTRDTARQGLRFLLGNSNTNLNTKPRESRMVIPDMVATVAMLRLLVWAHLLDFLNQVLDLLLPQVLPASTLLFNNMLELHHHHRQVMRRRLPLPLPVTSRRRRLLELECLIKRRWELSCSTDQLQRNVAVKANTLTAGTALQRSIRWTRYKSWVHHSHMKCWTDFYLLT